MIILKLIGITFSRERLVSLSLSDRMHAEKIVLRTQVPKQILIIITDVFLSNIHCKPLQESSILSVMGKQCSGDHGPKRQYLISDTLILHIMMSISNISYVKLNSRYQKIYDTLIENMSFL